MLGGGGRVEGEGGVRPRIPPESHAATPVRGTIEAPLSPALLSGGDDEGSDPDSARRKSLPFESTYRFQPGESRATSSDSELVRRDVGRAGGGRVSTSPPPPSPVTDFVFISGLIAVGCDNRFHMVGFPDRRDQTVAGLKRGREAARAKTGNCFLSFPCSICKFGSRKG